MRKSTGDTILPSPSDAYAAVQKGQYARIAGRKMSKWYTWSDALATSGTVTNSNRKKINQTAYFNAAELAAALDNVCDRVNQRVPITSWIRIQTKSSYHTTGEAVDFAGAKSFLHGAVYNAVRRTPQIKGIGQSSGGGFVGLHVDIGAVHAAKGGHQYWLIDNGAYGGGDIWLPVEPASSSRTLGYRQRP